MGQEEERDFDVRAAACGYEAERQRDNRAAKLAGLRIGIGVII